MQKTILDKKISIIGLAILLTLIAVFGFVQKGHANPSYFDSHCSLAAATSTLTFMTPGKATTTIYCDTGVGISQAWNTAILEWQQTASSTGKQNLNFEFAHNTAGIDCTVTPTACDWYPLNSIDIATSSSVAAGNIYISQNGALSWTFASSSQGGANVSTTNNISLQSVTVKIPTRYVRAYFTVPVGTTNSAVWAQFIGKRETSY